MIDDIGLETWQQLENEWMDLIDIFVLYQLYIFQFLLFLPLEIAWSTDNAKPGLLVGERYKVNTYYSQLMAVLPYIT